MCYPANPIIGLNQYNWEGDEIIHDTQVPSSRPVVGKKSILNEDYPIDIREFLVSERNCIMRNALDTKIANFIKNKLHGDLSKFKSRTDGSFDYRANVIAEYLSREIKYNVKEKIGKYWLFPDETLHIEEGDCEDRAFLLASLMIASGISSYNIRVALGQVKYYNGSGKPRAYDHVWVMYKNEHGNWILFEPLHMRHTSKKHQRVGMPKLSIESTQRVEYIPWFLFNDAHLWRVALKENRGKFEDIIEKKWKRFDPTFAGQVHRNIIIDEALKNAPQWFIDGLKRNYLSVPFSSSYLDKIDIPWTYDPRDHFDNGYIDEGWRKVKQSLNKFKLNNHDLDSFALATHAIADFYAHTSYAHFAKLDTSDQQKPKIQIYDHDNPGIWYETKPDYSKGTDFDLASGRFSINKKYWSKPLHAIPAVWNGQIISGRYAQHSDSQSFIERFVYIPEELEAKTDFPKRGSLPHHDEIAVDDSSIKSGSSHKLYNAGKGTGDERMLFINQFNWRKNAAVEHVKKVFGENWNKS